VVDTLETGSVAVNDGMNLWANPYLRIGGVKESGVGYYHSEEGLRCFCRVQSVIENKRYKRKGEIYWLPYKKGTYESTKAGMNFFFSRSMGKRIGALGGAVKLFLKLL
jgi:hypothetical protein